MATLRRSGRWRKALAVVFCVVPSMVSARAAAESAASFEDSFPAVEVAKGESEADSRNAPPPSALPPGSPDERALPSTRPTDRRARFRALIEKEAEREGLAPDIAEAVMAVESSYNPDAIGGVGEIGLMQILPSTARMLGFAGTLAELAVPETNIHYGVTYLARAWRLAGGDLCTAVMKYRAGHGETRFSYQSVNYCVAVRGKLLARGIPVAGRVPVATFGEPGRAGAGCGRKCLGTAFVGHVNIDALNRQLSQMVVRVAVHAVSMR